MTKQPESNFILQQLIQRKVEEIATQAYNIGYSDGLNAGEIIGYVRGVNDLKPAISDGLRSGSSECGRAMQGLKNIGVYSEE